MSRFVRQYPGRSIVGRPLRLAQTEDEREYLDSLEPHDQVKPPSFLSTLEPSTRIILLVAAIGGVGVLIYLIIAALITPVKPNSDETKKRAAAHLKAINEARAQDIDRAFLLKASENDRQRLQIARIVLGSDNLTPMEGNSNTFINLGIAEGAGFAGIAKGVGFAGAALGDGDKPLEEHHVYIVMNVVATALCPKPDYFLWAHVDSLTWQCFANCPIGYDQIDFAPSDSAGKPLEAYPIDPLTGKEDPTKPLKPIPPTPWCRAQCPIELRYKGPSADIKKHPLGLSDMWEPVTDNTGKPVRRDVPNDAAFCKRSYERRTLLKGGKNIVCGWCTQSIGVSTNKSATSVNRHHCETDSNHYGIDFTRWCQRRRMIPNLRVETTGDQDTNDEKVRLRVNILETAICAAPGGNAGGQKKSWYIQGPKACRGDAELLPINPMGYFDGFNHVGRSLASPGDLFFGTKIHGLTDDMVVAQYQIHTGDAGPTPISAFQYGCYSNCPLNMSPIGAVENHICAESCPPNTVDVTTLSGTYGQCKKLAYLMPVAIDDFMLRVQDLAVRYLHSYGYRFEKDPFTRTTEAPPAISDGLITVM